MQNHSTMFSRSKARPTAIAVTLVITATLAIGAFASTPATPFFVESQSAMTRMMSAMEIRQTGDVDRDFAAMMIAHHQGAIDMAIAEIRYGSNVQLKRLAQEIVVTQTQEIRVMRAVVDQSAARAGR